MARRGDLTSTQIWARCCLLAVVLYGIALLIYLT